MSRQPTVMAACLLLFGTPALPAALTAERLRGAFRRMALATHPDANRRVDASGRDFIRVQEAYELLRRSVPRTSARSGSPAASSAHREPPPSPPRTSTPWFWKGRVPSRQLRLAEYLFYTGAISWNTMIGAIVEQRRSRSRIGQLAQERHLIDGRGLAAALAARKPGERLGEALWRLGLLTRAAVEGLLAEQRRAQRPLGRQLIALGGVLPQDLPGILARQRQHNRAFASRA